MCAQVVLLVGVLFCKSIWWAAVLGEEGSQGHGENSGKMFYPGDFVGYDHDYQHGRHQDLPRFQSHDHQQTEAVGRPIPLSFIQEILGEDGNIANLEKFIEDSDESDESSAGKMSVTSLSYTGVEPAATKRKLYTSASGIKISDRFGDNEAQERSAAIKPEAATCKPVLQQVPFSSDDPSIIFVPPCTRVERCGGCCVHELFSCQPTHTETVSFIVRKAKYTGGNKFKSEGKQIIQVEKHTKCKCACKKKPEDCNKYQQYRISQCQCVCKNFDEEQKCYREMSKKFWNADTCSCDCRDVGPCTTGYTFDHNECRCVAKPVRRRNVLSEEEKQNT